MKIFSANKGLRVLFYSLILASLSTSVLARAHASPTGKAYFQQVISGTVSDATGPLQGAVIIVKGTTRSTISDVDGKFSITASKDEVLVFSFTGFKTVEITVGEQSVVNILLQEDTTQLEELQINAGYYNVKQKEATGNIARITAKDIERQPVANPLAAIQGRMPGVDIVQSTGVPGGGFSIRIRGRNSIRTDGNEPLYIVDGMPYASENLSSANATQGILQNGGISPLNGINPLDIESIEVLKDADATAIYGSRGANGVVLITTKKGEEGQTQVSFNMMTGVSQVTRFQKLMNTSQYLTMREQAFANDGFTELPAWAYDTNGTWSRTRYTDWQKELLGGTAVTQNANVGISGGNEQTKFVLGGTMYKEGTVFPGDFDFQKTSFHSNVNHTSADRKFQSNVSVNYVLSDNNLPGNDLTYRASTLPPNAPELYNEDGSLNWENSTWQNPLAILEEKYLSKVTNLTAGGNFSYLLSKGLSFKATLGYTESNIIETRFSPVSMYDPAFGVTPASSRSLRNTAKQESWNVEPQLNYTTALWKGTLDVLAGLTFQERKTTVMEIIGTGFSTDNLIGNLAAASSLLTTANDITTYRYNAALGRINYNIDGKYIINLTGRRDGSSRFGDNKRFANFGAIGAAWLFSREAYVNEGLPWMSFGKIRASYGITGNDQIGDYQYLNTYGTTGTPYHGAIGLQPLRLYNADFSWETNRKVEAALETGFFNDRLFLSIAHYRNRSSNQLVGMPLSTVTGFPSVQANLDATVQNTGWEFELRGTPFSNDNFNWTASVNLSVARNKLLDFPDLAGSVYAEKYVLGQPLDIRKLYNFTGINTATGLYDFQDYNNDGILTYPLDSQYITSLAPEFFGGMQHNITYKNWQLDFLFQFVKQQGYNYTNTGSIPGVGVNQPVGIGNGGLPSGTGAVQLYTAGYNSEAITAFNRYTNSNGTISDASFIRLKNISLSYSLPANWSKHATCMLYLQGQNVLTITNFKGADPENQMRGSLPPLRTVSMGIRLNLKP